MYKRDYLDASIDILFNIMFFIINMIKKHETLLCHVCTLLCHICTYDTKKGKMSRFKPVPPQVHYL